MSKDLVVIEGLTIRQDAEGRYCLNDLHKAAGGAKADQPSDFLKNTKTHALLAQLNSENSRSIPSLTTQTGRNGGTFVVKELVYTYAMWISPKFNLKVIRAFWGRAEGDLLEA